MKLVFPESKKTKLVGVRLTLFDYVRIQMIAKRAGKSMCETCRVIILTALKELEKNKK